MVELVEVPGARERPSDCEVRVFEDGGTTRIEIPGRGASLIQWVILSGLIVVLLGWIFMGVALFFFGKPILIMVWIANHGVPAGIRHYVLWLSPYWVGMLLAGMATVVALLRTALTRESIEFTGDRVRHVRLFFNWESAAEFLYPTVRSFVMRTDPHGLHHGKLLLITQGDDHEVAEYLIDRDREWIESVANQLLRVRI